MSGTDATETEDQEETIFEGTPEEIERQWLEQRYRGDSEPQLTFRAVVTGMLLGALMALSNLYVSLKTGWSLGVTITAAILAFGIWTFIRLIFSWVKPFGPLENNAMQSVASAAGYMTGGGTVAAIPALMLVTGYKFTPITMAVWIGVLACLGVLVAIPLKRQMINIEQLRFPSGIAAAATVKSLHAKGQEATRKAQALGVAGLLGAFVALFRDTFHLFPEKLSAFGAKAAAYTISFENSLIMVGAGGIMGTRAAISQLVGSLFCYGVLAPWAYEQGAIVGELKYKTIVGWSVWIGASMMLTAGLTEFVLEAKSLKRAVADLLQAFSKKAPPKPSPDKAPYRKAADVDKDPEPKPKDPLGHIEVPMSWFGIGMAIFGPVAVWLQYSLFGIPIWMGTLAILMSLIIGVVAARSTGETDTTPTGAMGKLVQITFGVLHPGNMTTNLMTAQACGGVAIHSSDLLTDLKSGYLLGAKPRSQFFAQFFGVVAGTLIVVPVYLLLIPDASAIGDKFPAPGAQTWGAVAKLLATGLSSLHITARYGMIAGGVLGVLITVVTRFFPKHKAYMPSTIALGLAFTIPAWNAISMALGALAAWALKRGKPALAAALVVPVASGLIAGESLVGAANAIIGALK